MEKQKDTVKVLFSEQEIEKRIEEIAEQINQDYKGKSLCCVSVLKGGIFVTCSLVKRLTMSVSLDFIAVSSYGKEKKSSGQVNILKDLDESIEGKDVLVIEDIIDTGRTLAELLRIFESRNPSSLSICTLLEKKRPREASSIDIRYTGFVIPDHFVVGYGLDYGERYRNLPYIGIIEEEIHEGVGE
ncbi:hypoxanthine phosphoribosyltransferase [Clostridia bacterium]|nr:hypoxanthine phosphoribosyltransferase [Clostridia bacterium]